MKMDPTIFPNPTSVSPSAFAKALGDRVTERGIRKLCEAGMAGATRVGERWKIDIEAATRWLSNPDNAPKIAERLPMDMTESDIADVTVAITAAPPPPPPPSNGSVASVLEYDIPRIRLVAAALLDVMTGGKFEPRAASMLKQTLSELRLAETHVLAMRQADARLMDRDRHRIILTTVAASFRTELESVATRWPDAILSGLTEADVTVSDPSEALRVIGQIVEGECHRLLTSLADTIERMNLGDQT